MKTEVNPKDATRAEAFEMWMTSPMPMVTLIRTFNVGNLVKASKKLGMKFNSLLCWCIGKAVTQMEEFIQAYQSLTTQAAAECKSTFLEDYMIVGTSVMWGKYRKGWFRTMLPISFQFHHPIRTADMVPNFWNCCRGRYTI